MSGAAGAIDLPRDRPEREHRLDLIRSAVTLLATGGARRVTLIGLDLDGQALREVELLVRANGMTVRAVPGHIGYDVTVEASG